MRDSERLDGAKRSVDPGSDVEKQPVPEVARVHIDVPSRPPCKTHVAMGPGPTTTRSYTRPDRSGRDECDGPVSRPDDEMTAECRSPSWFDGGRSDTAQRFQDGCYFQAALSGRIVPDDAKGCGRWDSNPHQAYAHQILSLAPMPIRLRPRAAIVPSRSRPDADRLCILPLW